MIVFKSVELKNFLSVGEEVVKFSLNSSPITMLSGSNGSGKSTLIDSISFVLFGKSFREIKKGLLINSTNKKNSMVRIDFLKGDNQYSIIRGQKPARLEIFCNNKAMNEEASVSEAQRFIEKQILGFDFNTFSRVCVMSTMNYTPFMSLTPFERRNFVENMLDLKMFTEMNKLHKTELSILKDTISKIEKDLSITDTKLNEKKNFIEYINNTNKKSAKEHEDKVKSLTLEYNSIKDGLLHGCDESIKEQKSILKEKELTQKELKSKSSDMMSKISVYKSKIKDNNNTIDYVSNHDNCDVCMQKITEDNSLEIINKLKDINDNISDDISSEKKSINELIISLESISSEISNIKGDINSVSAKRSDIFNKLEVIKFQINQSEKEIQEIKNVPDDLNYQYEDIKNLEDDKIKLAEEFESSNNDLEISNTVLELLKDTGVKADIIRQYIPMLCGYVNMYLNKLNISLTFEMDENFNETITNHQGHEFSYNNLSAGERSRVDIGLNFAWRSVAKAKGSVNTNILILDEILDANLDEAGTSAAISIVKDISQDNTNVFIVSHKNNLEEYVDEVINIAKINGFTTVT